MNVTTNQIATNKLKEAQLNIDSLADFRNLNSAFITSPEKENVLLNELYTAWFEAGKHFMESNIADSSFYAFMQASIICRRYEAVTCTDELPEYWVVWPHSESKGWCERITGNL